MTIIGQIVIDLFTLSLDSTRLSGKRILKEKESKILRMRYNFEENHFLTLQSIADHFELSRERIRQLHDKALKKLRIAGCNLKEEDNPSVRLIKYLEKQIKFTGDSKLFIELHNFWKEHLPEVEGDIVVTLLSMLLSYDKNILKENKLYFQRRASKKGIKEDTRMQALQNNLLDNVIWFDTKTNNKAFINQSLLPKRKVNHDERYKSGLFYSAKCKRDIQYESQLEFRFIQILEALPIIKYYVEQPITVEYYSNNKHHTYTPDFVVLLATNEGFLVEVKDCARMVDCRVQRKVRALIDYCKTNGLGFLLTNGRHTINHILRFNYSKELEDEIKQLFCQYKILTYGKFLELKNKYNFKQVEFLAMVLSNNWTYYQYPFKLIRNKSEDYTFANIKL